MLKQLWDNVMWRFVIGFVLIYAVLYGFNYFWTGLTLPGGIYSSFADEHLDYISAMRKLILHAASILLAVFGYDNRVHDIYFLTIPGVKTIKMVYSCIGLNIICVWWAFVLSFPQKLKGKLINLLAGTGVIIFLNIIRIALVALSPTNGRFLNLPFNHHDVFNVVVYGIIILMVMKSINRITDNPVAE